jgi:protein-S-isoprenylcysteine O-methyltransferase Ste14
MSPWYAKVAILIAAVAVIAIRSPHGTRSWEIKVISSRKDRLEVVLMTLASIGFLAPLPWIATPWLGFAEFPLHVLPLLIGCVLLAGSLWLLYRSHADLGTNWSTTLEIREGHKLVTEGVYRRVRHPMYTAFLLYALGQALVIPNYVVGPSFLIAMTLLIALRLKREEDLMRGQFADAYDLYVARTKKFVPYIW